MATKRATGASGGFGGTLAGINAAMESDNKNRYALNKENNRRRFEADKMLATDRLARERNLFDREQSDVMAQNRAFQSRVWDKMEADKKAQEVDPNEAAAFTTGKFTPAMLKSLGEMSLEDQIAIISDMAKQKGFEATGSRDEVSDPGGWFGLGKKTMKVPTYSKKENLFSR